VAQHRPRELGEKALDEIEPGAVRRRESQLETAGRLLGEPGLGLFGYVSGMIVQNELDGCVSWIGGIDKLEKLCRPANYAEWASFSPVSTLIGN
jgi:hypothetical protein